MIFVQNRIECINSILSLKTYFIREKGSEREGEILIVWTKELNKLDIEHELQNLNTWFFSPLRTRLSVNACNRLSGGKKSGVSFSIGSISKARDKIRAKVSAVLCCLRTKHHVFFLNILLALMSTWTTNCRQIESLI